MRTPAQIQRDIDEIRRIRPTLWTWQERADITRLERELDLARNPSPDPVRRALEAKGLSDV